MNKKLLTLGTVITLLSNSLTAMAVSETVALEGIKVQENTIILDFDRELAPEDTGYEYEDYFKLYDGGTALTGLTAVQGSNSDEIHIPLPGDAFGKKLQILIYDGIKGSDNTESVEEYYASFENKGYFDDFSDKSNGDYSGWIGKSYNSADGMKVPVYKDGAKPIISNTRNFDLTQNKILPAGQTSENMVTFPIDAMLFYREDYEDYELDSQALEFDYTREITCKEDDDGACTNVRLRAYIMTANTTYTPKQTSLVTDGYYMAIEKQGKRLVIGKQTAAAGSYNIDELYYNLPGTVLKDKAADFKHNTPYSIKFEAEKTEEGTKLTIYVKENGVYAEKMTVTDTADCFESGKSFFMVGKSNWAYNSYLLDNIGFSGIQDITSEISPLADKIAELTEEIKTDINTLYDADGLNASGDFDVDKIFEIKEQIEFIESISGNSFENLASEELEKLNELMIYKPVKISGVGTTLNIAFKDGIKTSTLTDKIMVIDDEGYEIDTQYEIDTEDNKLLNVVVPANTVGKNLKIYIKEGIESVNNAQMVQSYYADIKIPGYFYDFDDLAGGKNSAWLSKTWSKPDGVAVKEYEGGIKPVYTPTNDAMIFVHEAFSEYKYGSQNIDFSYKIENSDSKALITYLMADDYEYARTSSTNDVVTNAYYVAIYGVGTKMVIGKLTGKTGMDNMYADVVPGTKLSSDKAISFGVGVMRDFRFVAEKVKDGVKITAYMKNTSTGLYEEICSATDKTEVLSNGGTFFIVPKSGAATTINEHIIDNVAYAGDTEAVPVEASVKISDIKIQMSETIASWGDFTKVDTKEFAEVISNQKFLEAIGEVSGYEAEITEAAEKMLVITAPKLEYYTEENADKSAVTVSGTVPSKRAGIEVKTTITIENTSGTDTVYSVVAITDAEGKFNVKQVIEATVPQGFATVSIDGYEFTKSYPDFDYFASKTIRNNIVAEINTKISENDVTGLVAVMENSDNALQYSNQLTDVIFADNEKAKQLAENLIARKKAGNITLTAENIKNEIMRSAVITAVNNEMTDNIFKDNKFLYEEAMGIADMDSEYEVSVKSVFDNDLTDEGKKTVAELLCKAEVEDEKDIVEKFTELVVLKTPSMYKSTAGGYGIISKILTEGTDKLLSGLDLTEYLKGNTSEVNRGLLDQRFEELSAMQTKINQLVKDNSGNTSNEPAVGGGSSGGGSGSGGGGFVSYAPITAKPEDNKPEQDNETNQIFNDINNVAWAVEAITELHNKGIINGMGDNKFAPSEIVTREQIAKMLCKTFNVTDKPENNFKDVIGGSWYEKSVGSLYSAGIINGISEDYFGVGMPVTRQDIAVMIYRLIGNNEKIGTNSFADSDKIADYAADAVNYLVSKKIINGFEDNTFRPTENCTRAQAAKIIFDAMNVR